MNTEEYEAMGVNIKVEIFDFDMMETIWPMSGYDDPGIWLPKTMADKYNDEQIGRWFLNKYLMDYGNSYGFIITKGEERTMTFKRKIRTTGKKL